MVDCHLPFQLPLAFVYVEGSLDEQIAYTRGIKAVSLHLCLGMAWKTFSKSSHANMGGDAKRFWGIVRARFSNGLKILSLHAMPPKISNFGLQKRRWERRVIYMAGQAKPSLFGENTYST